MKIAISQKGRRCGQTHPAAKLTDQEVELLRRMHEEEGWGYRRLAAKFEVSRSNVRDLCLYRYR